MDNEPLQRTDQRPGWLGCMTLISLISILGAVLWVFAQL